MARMEDKTPDAVQMVDVEEEKELKNEATEYFFPELGKTIKAKSIEEAEKKATSEEK